MARRWGVPDKIQTQFSFCAECFLVVFDVSKFFDFIYFATAIFINNQNSIEKVCFEALKLSEEVLLEQQISPLFLRDNTKRRTVLGSPFGHATVIFGFSKKYAAYAEAN